MNRYIYAKLKVIIFVIKYVGRYIYCCSGYWRKVVYLQ